MVTSAHSYSNSCSNRTCSRELPSVYHIGALCMNFIKFGTFSVLPECAVWSGEVFYLILVLSAGVCVCYTLHHTCNTQPLTNLHRQNTQNSEKQQTQPACTWYEIGQKHSLLQYDLKLHNYTSPVAHCHTK